MDLINSQHLLKTIQRKDTNYTILSQIVDAHPQLESLTWEDKKHERYPDTASGRHFELKFKDKNMKSDRVGVDIIYENSTGISNRMIESACYHLIENIRSKI